MSVQLVHNATGEHAAYRKPRKDYAIFFNSGKYLAR